MKKQTKHYPRTAAEGQREHATAILELAKRVTRNGGSAWQAKPSEVTWGHVGSMGYAREQLVIALAALGLISEGEAKIHHGVIL